MTYYLKYRPQTIAELDLVSARETLMHLIAKESLPHAFLFTGPRGTGKTSAARILAKAINCEHKEAGSNEPCNVCETCRAITKGTHIDVIEMDAASNRGIDEIRALKQDIMLAPALLKKKVYIIDEVHMLTTEAANALLKTLEEPPEHVVFILATTDPQKLPQTVVSRLSIVQFYKASETEVTEKLKKIVAEEKLTVEPEVYSAISNIADGSFRDAVKLLEEFALKSPTITLDSIQNQLHTGSNQSHELFLKLNKEGLESTMQLIAELTKQGVDGKAFLNSFIDEVHGALLKSVINGEKSAISESDCVNLLELLLEAKSRMMFSTNDFLPLEIALIKFKTDKHKVPEKKVETLPYVKTVPLETKVEVQPLVSATSSAPEKTDVVASPPITFQSKDLVDIDTWGRILLLMRERNASIEALLRATKPRAFDGSNLKLGVYFQFHKERLEMPATKILLEEVLSGVFGGTVVVQFALEDPPPKPQDEVSLQETGAPDIINAAKEIFGN